MILKKEFLAPRYPNLLPPRPRSLVYWILSAAIVATPWSFVRFKAISLGDVLLALSVLLFVCRTANLQLIFPRIRLHLYLGAAFVAISMISLFIPSLVSNETVDMWRAAVTVGQYAAIFLILPIISVAAANEFEPDYFSKLLTVSFLGPALLQTAVNFIVGSGDSLFYIAGRALLSYENANSAAIALSIILPFAVLLTLRPRCDLWWFVGLFSVATFSMCILLTGSVSGLLIFGFVVAASLTFLLWHYSHGRLVKSGILLLTVMVPLAATAAEVIATRQSDDQLRFRIEGAIDYVDSSYQKLRSFSANALNEIVGSRAQLSSQSEKLPAHVPSVQAGQLAEASELACSTESHGSTPLGASGPPGSCQTDTSATVQSKPEPAIVNETANEDQRRPSIGLRGQFLSESLARIEARYGIYGDGLGQAQVLRGDRLTHTVYVLLVEEGGLPLLFVYLGLLSLIGYNIFVSPWRIDMKFCLAVSLAALALSGLFQTHMYLRFYWVPLLLAFSTPAISADAHPN